MLKQKLTLPGYLVLDVIGRGRASVVWAGRRESDDLPVAIKWVPLADPSDESFRRRALEDARAAMRIDHPATVPLLEAGEAENGLYYVMEFIAGCTLAELLLRTGRLQPKHALTTAEGVALGLTHAWDRERLLHHDLNPGNIMIEQDGTVRIADLGILPPPVMPGDEDLAAEDARFLYAAPEQGGQPSGVDYRANIYSLGAILYQMVTGRPPIPETGASGAAGKPSAPSLPDPQDLNGEMTPGEGWLIEKMLVRDPLLRYRTWAEWLSDVREALNGGTLLSERPAAGQSVVRRGPRREAGGPSRAPLKAPLKGPKGFAPRLRGGFKRPRETPELPKTLAKPRRIALRASALPVASGLPASAPPGELSRDLLTLAALAGAAALAYGIVFYRARQGGAEPPSTAPAPAAATEPTWQTAAESTRPVRKVRFEDLEAETRPAAATAAAPAARQDAGGATWRHPAFLSGARLFNDSLEKYTRFIQDRGDKAVLTIIERQCREAIAAFESCRKQAPPDIRIDDLINQCYRLISDCRQLTLMPPPPAEDEED